MDVKLVDGKIEILDTIDISVEKEENAHIPKPQKAGIKEKKSGKSFMWLITFTDVMALMLTFFVLLFSMSEPKREEWTEITSTLNSEFGAFFGNKFEQGMIDDINIERIELNQALDLQYLKFVMKETLSKEPLLKNVSLIPQYDSLIISLPENLLFSSGSAKLTTDGKNAVYAIAGVLGKLGNRIEIMGQADPRPVSKNNQYKSNWDLSMARAIKVAALLHDKGYDKNIRVLGLSSGRYDELPEKWSEKDKLDLSRRVDIAVMEDDGRKIKYYDNKLLLKSE